MMCPRNRVNSSVSQKELGRALDVHHIRPVSDFDNPDDSNYVENLVTLCHDCHMLVEWNGIDFSLPERFRLAPVQASRGI